MPQAAEILDLVTLTLPKFKKFSFTDMSSDYRETIAFQRIFRQKKTKNDSDGVSIKWQLMTDTNGSFRFVGLGFTAEVSIPSTFIQGETPWRGWTYNWSVDGAEPAMQGPSEKIFDIMKARYFAGVGDMIKGVERALWRVPSSTSNNVLGIPYYVVKSNTAATFANNDGFNGATPSGHSTVAGINPTDQRRWQNYATQYTNVTVTDWLRKANRMADKIRFKPLVEDMPTYNPGFDYASYTNHPLYALLTELARSQNDNLGSDVAAMEGKAMFRRGTLGFVDELDNDTTNPFYMIDWNSMYAARLNNWWEKEIRVDLNPQQPTMATIHKVSRCNLVCLDRRRCGVIATDTTMPS